MKRLALILGCLLTVSAAHADYSGYAWQKKVTISSANVSNVLGTITNFPVLFVSTDVFFSTNATGGRQTGSYDLIASTLSDCSLKLFVDTETFNNGVAGSTLTAWVNLPLLTTATLQAATFYWCAGNAGVTTYQGVSSSTWDSNYKGVWHLPNGTTLTANDSTSNSYTGSITSVNAASGKIDGGGNLTTLGTSKIVVNNNPIINTSANATVSMWVNTTETTANHGYSLYVERASSGLDIWKYGLSSGTEDISKIGKLRFTHRDDSGNLDNPVGYSTTAVNDGLWHYVVMTKSSKSITFYVDGSSNGPFTLSGGDTLTNTGTASWIGLDPADVSDTYTGLMDEPRLSNTTRSADWIKTEYNNQSSPSTFETIGAEQAAPSGNAFWFGEF